MWANKVRLQKPKLMRTIRLAIVVFMTFFVSMLVSNKLYSQTYKTVIVPQGGRYAYTYNETPANLVSLINFPGSIQIDYQWEKSTKPLSDFAPVNGATNEQFTFTAPLTQTTYYRRKEIWHLPFNLNATIYSNTIQIEMVSKDWENMNYVRVHDVLVPDQRDWKDVDNLPIGSKLQSTQYSDGLGRKIQEVGKEMASPEGSSQNWADLVSYFQYDAHGRMPLQYLPYSTTSDIGKFKSSPITQQSQYHSAKYNETFPYTQSIYDGSPLNAVLNTKAAGEYWANSNGSSVEISFNVPGEEIRLFIIDYASGSKPYTLSLYGDYELIKTIKTDYLGKRVVEYVDKSGKLVCKKVQVNPTASILENAGWICSYYVYDDFGNLRSTIEGEAVAWLEMNNWTFSGTNGENVFNEYCFLYEYDEKGRMIVKKNPGAEPLVMIYNKRDLLVFMQDGKQRAKPVPEWTVNFYDPLDRIILTTIYKTNKTAEEILEELENASNGNMVVTGVGGGGALTDIEENSRNVTIQDYAAQNSVVFLPGFESVPNDDFVARIDPGAIAQPVSITLPFFSYPISQAELNNPSICTILKYLYYDDYSYPNVKHFDNQFANAQAYNNGEPIVTTKRTWNFPTGSMVRVLNTTTFLSSSIYYDDEGRPIQVLSDNIKLGTDIVTSQYRFDGTLISSHSKHTAPGTSYNNYSILTKNNLDKVGRLASVEKKFGSNPFKKVADYTLDDMGRMKKKRLDPEYTQIPGKNELEALQYSYNINGSLTGINKDYALKTTGVYDKWKTFFGQYLEYDNKSLLFANDRLDGLIAGTVWSTQGDDVQRLYDYEYDAAGRFTTAIFRERAQPNASDNQMMDFSVFGDNNGVIRYDLNGNILSMQHMGVVPGNNTPVKIDDLQYSYANNGKSNKLMRVMDQTGIGNLNGKFGDFSDGNSGGNDDYEYDENGNLVKDQNKNFEAIKYNYLDKPEEVVIAQKGIVRYTYDANGTKLKRTFEPNSGTAVSTYYVNQFYYKENDLQYIHFEEGRVRVMQAVNETNGYDLLQMDGNIDMPGGKRGAMDYFITDHLGNTRMVLTEETHLGRMVCTMETNRDAVEAPVFGQVDASGNPTAANEVRARFPVANIPGQATGQGWTNTSIGNHVSRLSTQSGQARVGPNVLLKVMAGDKLSATSIYYYQPPAGQPANSSNSSFISNIVTGLVNAISGSSVVDGPIKDGAIGIGSNIENGSISLQSLPEWLDGMPTSPGSTNIPRASLNVLFFDERFRFVEEGSQIFAVKDVTDLSTVPDPHNPPPLDAIQLRAPKNGYVFVFVSNESNVPVYFDNLQVTHDHQHIVEENHYYAYGLKIAAISSRKISDNREGCVTNNYLYQGDYSEMDEDLGWNDFDLRNYDPQIARWIQQDPYQQFISGYEAMGNNPIVNCDPNGGIVTSGLFQGMSELGRTGVMALGGAIIGGAIDALSGGDGGKGILIGAGVGLSASILASFDWNYFFNGSNYLNFFITGTREYLNSTKKLDAQRIDLTWARSKSAFSFGKLKIIQAASSNEAADKIKKILDKKGKSIGSIIADSHAHAEVINREFNNDDFDPRTSSLSIGNGDDPNNRIHSESDLKNNYFLNTLSPYVTSSTKFFAGNCWGGAPEGNLTTLKKMSQIGNWKTATFYGEASETISSSLFLRNSFTANWHIDVKFYENGNIYNGRPGRKYPTISFAPYPERSRLGVFNAVKNGNVYNPGTVYFNRGGSIYP